MADGADAQTIVRGPELTVPGVARWALPLIRGWRGRARRPSAQFVDDGGLVLPGQIYDFGPQWLWDLGEVKGQVPGRVEFGDHASGADDGDGVHIVTTSGISALLMYEVTNLQSSSSSE